MTPEQKRIAIAEACGWTHYHLDLWVPPGTEDFSELDCDSLPDYLSDLNAMHEAEKVLTEDQWGPYCVILNKIVCRIQCENTHTCGYTIAATAAQRAEAFLRTLNLWTND